MKTPREIIATSGCVLGHGLKDRGRRQSADSIIFDLEEAGYVIARKTSRPNPMDEIIRKMAFDCLSPEDQAVLRECGHAPK